MSPTLLGLGAFLSKMTMVICISKLVNIGMQPIQAKLDVKLQTMKKELEQELGKNKVETMEG